MKKMFCMILVMVVLMPVLHGENGGFSISVGNGGFYHGWKALSGVIYSTSYSEKFASIYVLGMKDYVESGLIIEPKIKIAKNLVLSPHLYLCGWKPDNSTSQGWIVLGSKIEYSELVYAGFKLMYSNPLGANFTPYGFVGLSPIKFLFKTKLGIEVGYNRMVKNVKGVGEGWTMEIGLSKYLGENISVVLKYFANKKEFEGDHIFFGINYNI